MTTRAAQRPGIAGAVMTMNTAAAADAFTNNGEVLLVITNGAGSSITCTLDDPNTPVPAGSSANNDAVLTVAAGATKVFGPFPPSRFNDANDAVQMAWSSVTTVTWAAVATK